MNKNNKSFINEEIKSQVYDYFCKPQIAEGFEKITWKKFDDYYQGYYKDYIVATMKLVGKSLVLVRYNFDAKKVFKAEQKKIINEYNSFFTWINDEFFLFERNLILALNYFEMVIGKIDKGFEKYTALFEGQSISISQTASLQIKVDNDFSINDLTALMNSYNELYSLFNMICIDGFNDKSEATSSMVLESIQIASPGFIVTAGKEVLIEIIKVFVNNVLSKGTIDQSEKRQLIEKANRDQFLAERRYVFELIEMLEAYTEARARGGKSCVQVYKEFEIKKIIDEIERLQGTSHIDVCA